MVRGFALFGVLLVNMYNFGATSPTWTSPSDEIALALTQVLFETKSFRLFSFLFGFGIALQMARAERSGVAFLPFYLRRMAVLFMIGMANCLLYDGDVLMLYAEFGLILLLFRRVPGSVLILGWLSLNLVFPVQRTVTFLMDPPESVPSAEVRLVQARESQQEFLQSHPYSVGSVGEVVAFNAWAIPPNPLDETSFLGMCLLGVYAARRRIFQGAEAQRPLIRKTCVWGLSLGLLAIGIERVLRFSAGYEPGRASDATVLQQLLGDLCIVFGATALCLGYAAGIVLLARQDRIRRFLVPLGAVGRFALTVYLMQTVMFSLLFYGFGFGQAARIGPATVAMYAVLFFALQVVACQWWARHFRFGPVEWVWRNLSYMRRQPIRL